MTRISWSITHHEDLVSTNDRMREEARLGAPDRSVIVARRQSGGRGRAGSQWASPEGGLYMSCLLREVPGPLAPLLALAAGAALAETLDALRFRPRHWLKWPNDLLIGPPDARRPEGKAAGILVESVSRGARLEYAVVGVGVNLVTAPSALPQGLDPPAVSFASFQDPVPEAGLFLEVFLSALDGVMSRHAKEPAGLIARLLPRLAWRGEEVVVHMEDGTHLMGTLAGIAPDGALLVRTAPDRTASCAAWDVARLDPASGPLPGRRSKRL